MGFCRHVWQQQLELQIVREQMINGEKERGWAGLLLFFYKVKKCTEGRVGEGCDVR